MTFHSILFERRDAVPAESVETPCFFGDLNLDQVVDAVTAGKQDYNLKPFFYTPLHDADTIRYRQDIARDLENRAVLESINSFALKMSEMSRYLAMIDGLSYKYHKEGWFLEAARVYCKAVADLEHDLSLAHLESRGMVAFREYLTNYARADGFTSLVAETQETQAALASVKYCVNIKGSLVQVRRYEDESDYSADVEQTFEKFKQGAVKDYRVKLALGLGMSHVEAQILDLVAKLYPDVFLRLDQYPTREIGT